MSGGKRRQQVHETPGAGSVGTPEDPDSQGVTSIKKDPLLRSTLGAASAFG